MAYQESLHPPLQPKGTEDVSAMVELDAETTPADLGFASTDALAALLEVRKLSWWD